MKPESSITVVVKEVGQAPEVRTIQNDYKAFQQIVNGPYTPIRLGSLDSLFSASLLDLCSDEEGNMKPAQLPNLGHFPNARVSLAGGVFVGNVFIAANNRTRTKYRSLTESEIDEAKTFLEAHTLTRREVAAH